MAIHPGFQGNTLDGSNTKENVIRFITGGMCLDDDHFIRGGKAIVSPLDPEATTQPFITPRSIIYHTNSGSVYSTWQRLKIYLMRAGIDIEPHFDVDLNGVLAGFIPLNRKADCNYKANRWYDKDLAKWFGAISFESADHGYPALENEPWTIEQLNSIIGASVIICIAYGVWCTPTASWNDTGIDYHSKYKEWSVYVGKTCPGAARKRQMPFIHNEVALRIAEYYKQCGGTCGVGFAV